MSGIQMALLGGASFVGVYNPIQVTRIEDVRIGSSAFASVQFSGAGGLSLIGTGTTGGPRWYNPLTTGIGASYWVRCTANVALSSGTLNTWQVISPTAPLFQWSQTTLGVKEGLATFEISTSSSGTPVIASVSNVPIYLERA